MASQRYRKRVEALLGAGDIRIDGDRPWDVHIHNEEIFPRVVADGMLGVGEGYMEGWWDCEQLDEMICRAYLAKFHRLIRPLNDILYVLHARLVNLQRKARAYQVGQQHYDLGQDVYRAMLDAEEDTGLATIYRVLTQFEAAGLVVRHNFEGGHAVFELDSGQHHDHIVCTQCGKIVEFMDKLIEQRQLNVAKEHGFKVSDHSLVLYGKCVKPQCPNRPATG